MSKKKLSEVQRLKREVEALKAQVRSEAVKVENVIEQRPVSATPSINKKLNTTNETNSARYTLPVKEIKHDLVRIAVFSFVSIGLIVLLGVLRIDVANIVSNLPKF